MTSARPCPVCSGTAVESLHTQRFVLPEGHPLAVGYDVVLCGACGFVYADVAATQADYDRFYAEQSKYDDATTSTGAGEADYDRMRLAAVAADLAACLPDKAARILDVGCAGGGLLAALADLGYSHLVGVDPSAGCAARTRDRVGEAYQGWLTSLPADLGTFDAIVLSHVLEHVLDLQAALAALAPRLSPGGLVYVEVPDAERYADYVYAPFQDFNTEHINHFSEGSLDNALGRHGFAPIARGRRVLNASATTFTPAVHGIYRENGAPHALAPDRSLAPAIEKYVDRSAALLTRIGDAIDEALARHGELVVWGAGQLTLKLLAETRLGEARIAAIVDSNPIHHGKTLAGVAIAPPAALAGLAQPILIATLLHQTAIEAQIVSLGCQNPIIRLPAPEVAHVR
jgi:SAM-dependent methyltransferase